MYPIMPGGWCIPSAIQCLTGADYESVIHPSLNRHSGAAEMRGLLSMVTGVVMNVAVLSLRELGCHVRRYRGDSLGSHVATWARRSADRYPGRALLIATRSHALVIKDGRVYDNHLPAGAAGEDHPFAKCPVVWCALVERHNA